MWWLRFLPYGIVVVFCLGAWYWINDMQSTIATQKKDIEYKEQVISIQAGNIQVMKEQFKIDIAREVFNATVKEKKKQIEKGINRDENKSVDIDSTRIYPF
jgi:hypothetical protein